MAKNDLLDFDPANDFEAYFDRALNKAVPAILSALASPDNSPVYTGYFASSWRVAAGKTAQEASGRLGKEDRPTTRANRETGDTPWADIFRQRNSFGNARGPKPKSGGYIKPRFSEVPYINFQKNPVINIGNVASYAGYALENPIVATFVQGTGPGQLQGVIDRAFKETPDGVRLRVATGLRSRAAGSVQYTDLL